MKHDLSSLSALIVEDDPVFAALCETLLADAGAGSIAVSLNDADLYARLASLSSVNLVVLDLNMKGLDGLAIMRKLADQSYSGQLALISGADSAILESSARFARLLGLRLISTLAKPVRPADIGELLRKWSPPEAIISRAQAPSELKSNPDWDFVPVYQPKFHVSGTSVAGAEALMRIRGKNGKLMPPAAALAQLTEAGRMGEATLALLDLILVDLQSFGKSGAGTTVSINVPAPLLESGSFTKALSQRLEAENIPPSRIIVEVTETAMPKDMSAFVEAATRLRMAGFGLSLDDFGTGMANYDILRLCPFTELKIDRSLVQSTTFDPLACGFVGNCVSIARTLKLNVVAEGVETSEQAEAVRRLGVNLIQGYHFSMPLSSEGYIRLLRKFAAS